MPPIYQVDAFTDTPFRGNPAAVCLLEGPREAEWMQAVAAEMNLSETAFVRPADDGGEGFELRWFTPTIEVNLCGHATLATAHVLWETGWLGVKEAAHFHTRSGLLAARRVEEGIELDFPADPVSPLDDDYGLAALLGERVVGTYRAREDWLVELESAEAVRACRPDFAGIKALPLRGLAITALGDNGFDFISRFFAPGAGIDEDPVTGSAHCILAGFWGDRLGRDVMRAHQASGRGGELTVRRDGVRVRLIGRAVTVLRGELCA